MQPAAFFKCLSDPTRLHAVALLWQEGELCVCELTSAMAISQPKLSRHLAQLRNCGVLQGDRRGQWVYYSVHPGLPDWAKKILTNSQSALTDVLSGFHQNLEHMPDRPVCCPAAITEAIA